MSVHKIQILLQRSDRGATNMVQKIFDTFCLKIRDPLGEAAQVYNVHSLMHVPEQVSFRPHDFD